MTLVRRIATAWALEGQAGQVIHLRVGRRGRLAWESATGHSLAEPIRERKPTRDPIRDPMRVAGYGRSRGAFAADLRLKPRTRPALCRAAVRATARPGSGG